MRVIFMLRNEVKLACSKGEGRKEKYEVITNAEKLAPYVRT